MATAWNTCDYKYINVLLMLIHTVSYLYHLFQRSREWSLKCFSMTWCESYMLCNGSHPFSPSAPPFGVGFQTTELTLMDRTLRSDVCLRQFYIALLLCHEWHERGKKSWLTLQNRVIWGLHHVPPYCDVQQRNSVDILTAHRCYEPYTPLPVAITLFSFSG